MQKLSKIQEDKKIGLGSNKIKKDFFISIGYEKITEKEFKEIEKLFKEIDVNEIVYISKDRKFELLEWIHPKGNKYYKKENKINVIKFEKER